MTLEACRPRAIPLPRLPLDLRLPELVVVHALRGVVAAPVERAVVEGDVPLALLEASPDLAPESGHEALDVRRARLQFVLAAFFVAHVSSPREGLAKKVVIGSSRKRGEREVCSPERGRKGHELKGFLALTVWSGGNERIRSRESLMSVIP